MAVNNSKDSRINVRSPYFIEAGREAPEPVDIPEVVDPPTNTAPTVTITATNKSPYLGETVILTAEATDSDGTIVSYLWGGTASPLITKSITITNTDTVESQTYTVLVIDNDGDSAVAQIIINWQEEPVIIQPPQDSTLECGEIYNEGAFIGEREYTLDVGDKIGDVDITFLSPPSGTASVPVKFTATWDSTTETTDYIGDSAYDEQVTNLGVDPNDLNTSATQGISNKTTGTQLTISKTSAEPETISFKAFAPLQNDSFSFRLDCPNVLEVPTKFVTLESTCSDGAAVITYTDVDGVTQTVTLENQGDIEVVSAQPNTAVVQSCTATVTEGGISLDKGTPDKDIDTTLEINIILDGSGFASTSGNQIKAVTDRELKDSLVKFYNNDTNEYEKRVRIFDSYQLYAEQNGIGWGNVSENQGEAFLNILSNISTRNSDTTKVVNLYFTDETNPVYNTFGKSVYSEILGGGSVEIKRVTSTYESHLSAYKTFLDTLAYGDQLTTVFQVINPGTPSDWFYNVFNGTGSTSPDQYGRYEKGFEGSRGLSDRASEIKLVTDVRQGVSYSSEPLYYYNLITQALKDYGYNI